MCFFNFTLERHALVTLLLFPPESATICSAARALDRLDKCVVLDGLVCIQLQPRRSIPRVPRVDRRLVVKHEINAESWKFLSLV